MIVDEYVLEDVLHSTHTDTVRRPNQPFTDTDYSEPEEAKGVHRAMVQRNKSTTWVSAGKRTMGFVTAVLSVAE